MKKFSIGKIVPSTVEYCSNSIRTLDGKHLRSLFEPFDADKMVIILPLEDFEDLLLVDLSEDSVFQEWRDEIRKTVP